MVDWTLSILLLVGEICPIGNLLAGLLFDIQQYECDRIPSIQNQKVSRSDEACYLIFIGEDTSLDQNSRVATVTYLLRCSARFDCLRHHDDSVAVTQ